MFTIREGIKEDCVSLEAMIKELADYYKMSNQAILDHKQLEIDGFDDDYNKRLFYTFVAELTETKELIGFVLYFFKYSTWKGKCVWLEDIYVKPQYRGNGIGLGLWRSVAKHAIKESCDRLELNTTIWNKDTIARYEKFGATNMTQKEGWIHFRFERENINTLAQQNTNFIK